MVTLFFRMKKLKSLKKLFFKPVFSTHFHVFFVIFLGERTKTDKNKKDLLRQESCTGSVLSGILLTNQVHRTVFKMIASYRYSL